VEEVSDSETFRFAGGLSYELDDGPLFSLSAVHAENDFRIVFSDLLADEFFLPGTTTVRNDFAVFGTSITDPALANDPGIVDRITTQVPIDFASSLTTAEGTITGTAFETASGPVGFATGMQYRVNRSSFDADDRLNEPGNLVFLFPIDDFDEQSISAISVFAETQVPVGPAIDVQAALRYEDYSDGIGSSLDPQVAVTAEVVEDLVLRASAGTAFRAPTPLQTGGTTNQVAPIVNPCTGQRGATSIVTRGNADLDPEDSFSFSGGFAYRQPGGLRASVDFFRYDYDGVITRESPEAVAAGAQCVQAAPGVFVPVAEGLSVNPQTGQIAQIEVDFVNAGSIETDGFDIAMGYTLDTDRLGRFDLDLSGTILTSFDVAETPGAPSVDRLGSRNVGSFTRPTPQIRANLSLGWSTGRHRVTAITRYTDSYRDDLNNDARIDSLTTFDLQYALSLDGLILDRDSELRLGVINLTDEDPPFVFDRGGYDPLVGDPRGRIVYVALTQAF
jgi:iron complex outermembrane receptor protein